MQTVNEQAAIRFHEGNNCRAYEYMGVHKTDDGYCFRVWAPRADTVMLAGDFNGWAENMPLVKVTDGGIWEINVEDGIVKEGDKYKYKIYGGGQVHYKADPFAFCTEKQPETASVVPYSCEYKWKDSGWFDFRQKGVNRLCSMPINIYEVHLGSWRKHEDGSFLNYKEIAVELAPYVKQMGYTHIQLMPITEYPYDGSWGYQACSYFAPTARYGTPDQFKALVDKMHEAGVGVILDWCPAYFPNDRYGLFEFDGKPLYEYEAKDVADSSEGCIFNVKRGEVKSFLLSSAFYWLREFHIDALKVSYALDKNKYTDSTLYAGDVEFLKVLNFNIKREFTDVFTLADGATKWRGVTSPEGLGFDLACSANWSEEVLGYGGIDPIFRKYHHSQINSILQKSFEERYVLTITHDDVTRGKKSFLDKMHGDYWQKFANARAILGYMMTSPGKKTFFMGGEIGHFREWDHEGEMEWFLLEYDAHAKFQRYVAELNHLYLSSHELWENDGAYGFCFVDADNAEQSIISYRRFSNEGKELQIIINFTPVVYENYFVGVPSDGEYEEMINSDDIRFGGGGVVNKSPLQAKKEMAHGLPYSLNLNIPPLGMIVLRKK